MADRLGLLVAVRCGRLLAMAVLRALPQRQKWGARGSKAEPWALVIVLLQWRRSAWGPHTEQWQPFGGFFGSSRRRVCVLDPCGYIIATGPPFKICQAPP